MFMRQVIITRYSNVADPDGISKNKLVQKAWKLPRGYFLCELFDPVFEAIYNWDMAKQRAAFADEGIRARSAAVIAEEMALFAPLYGQEKRRSPFVKLGVPCQSVLYSFLDKQPIRWPELGHSPNWETARSIEITGELKSALHKAPEELSMSFQEWVDAMTALGEISRARPITFSDENFVTKCEFKGACGDAAMALFMLLTEAKKVTSVQSVGFFLPTDIKRRYLPIGRAAKR
jgi:hypothetical protein